MAKTPEWGADSPDTHHRYGPHSTEQVDFRSTFLGVLEQREIEGRIVIVIVHTDKRTQKKTDLLILGDFDESHPVQRTVLQWLVDHLNKKVFYSQTYPEGNLLLTEVHIRAKDANGMKDEINFS
jgi:hypothetical protein